MWLGVFLSEPKMTSAESLLKRKFIEPDDPDYGLVPIMAVWSMRCEKCGVYCISSSRIGVMSRSNAHRKKCNSCG